ncbi:TIGR04197 family type VII secretion effector [Enterococcus sp. AZ109]|uniref:TIGR04197 family type VII secretion effector n=1 Tax=Enterococcus sp. AZ109 TaxID=2774634 RepID=UPI003F1EC68E
MTGIKSNFGQAQLKATALRNAATEISSVASANKDTKTTVSGNANAQSAIDAVSKAAQKVSSAVNSASVNIQSVAQNFQALDQTGKNLFRRDL